MAELLIKKFIKDSENVGNDKVRISYGVLAGWTGVAVNVLLFIIKFLAGTLTGAVSITADAFNNLSDVASSVVSMVGAVLSGRPADKDHPFGHGRYEYVASLFVAFLVFEVGFSLLKDSVAKILHPEELTVSLLPIIILVVSIALKFWLSAFNTKLGKKINSTTLLAAAADSRNDCISTAATILSLLAYKFFGLNIDGIVGLAVSLLIIKCAVDIAKETIEPLIGGNIDTSLNSTLREFFLSHENVLGCHDLIVHNYGEGKSYATVHIEIDDRMSQVDSHILMDGLERECWKKFGIHLVTHTDPLNVSDPETVRARAVVEDAVKGINDPRVTCHDVRVVKAAEKRTNVVFDLVVPYSFAPDETKKVIETIRGNLKQCSPDYDVVITVEHSFVGEVSGE